ncbi:acyl-ACP--UDP-N-acetylglucosamine O-acyltransferase [Candidatus Neomarinimicrobiota bacterium]
MDLIHPTAQISSKAELGKNVKVGPFAIIEDGVAIGDGTEVMGHAQVLRGATIGQDCVIHPGAVVSGIPQDLKFGGDETYAKLGDRVTVREYVTINRGTDGGNPGTIIGSDVLLMACVHVGHDTIIGNCAVIANAVLFGGYAVIGDYAGIGGGTPVHQFCRIGDHAFVAGGFRVVQDVPPFITAGGEPLRYSGLNSTGLKRRGFSQETRNLIKRAYREIFRSDKNIKQALEVLHQDFEQTTEIQSIISFLENSERGLI